MSMSNYYRFRILDPLIADLFPQCGDPSIFGKGHARIEKGIGPSRFRLSIATFDVHTELTAASLEALNDLVTNPRPRPRFGTHYHTCVRGIVQPIVDQLLQGEIAASLFSRFPKRSVAET